MIRPLKTYGLGGFIFSGLFMMAITAASALDEPMTGYVQLENTTDGSSKGAVSSDITLTVAPFGPTSGPRIAITGAADRYRYWTDAERNFRGTGGDRSVEALFGYALVVPNLSITASLGPIFIDSHQREGAFGPSSSSSTRGWKYKATLYATPISKWMLYSQAFYTDVTTYYSVQAKIGYAIAPGIFIGPETTFAGTNKTEQRRFGAHVSGITIGSLGIGLSAGIAFDSELGRGAYGAIYSGVNF